MVIRTNSIAIIVIFLLLSILGVVIYNGINKNKGGYDCEEGECVFNNESSVSKKTCETKCKKINKVAVKSSIPEKLEEHKERRFIRDGEYWLEVQETSPEFKNAWTSQQIKMHSESGYARDSNKNDSGYCPSYCDTDITNVLLLNNPYPVRWPIRGYEWGGHHQQMARVAPAPLAPLAPLAPIAPVPAPVAPSPAPVAPSPAPVVAPSPAAVVAPSPAPVVAP